MTGGTGNDTFTADNTGTDTTSTADVLNGGNGTDTLNVFSDGAAFALPALTSIETVNIYDQNADLNISGSTWNSVTTANVLRGDGAVKLTVSSNVTTVGISDVTLAGDSGGANGATVEGVQVAFAATATSGTINVSNVTTAAAATDEDIVVSGAALTGLTVNATGTASSVDELDAAAATSITINAAVGFTAGVVSTTGTATMTITGAGAVNVGTLDADINTVTATANTGGVTAAIGANVDTSFTGSAGNDVITASTTDTIATTDTLAVNGGAGTDVLVVGDANDINTTADGARYTNFETIRVAADQNVSYVSGITAIQVEAATDITLSGISATQAGAVTVRGDQSAGGNGGVEGLKLTLTSATGSSDAVTLNLSSATATTNVDVDGLHVAGVESLTINSTTGTNAATFVDAGTSNVTFVTGGADKLTSITVTGSKDTAITTGGVITNAVTITAAALTGDFAISGDLTAGSSVTGTANADSMTLSTTNGTTYNGGAGNDTFSAAVAGLVATGGNDNKVNGGDGTDTLSISTAAATLTDNHFTYVTGMEKLTTAGTGSTSITTGGSFNAAFASGVTITTGTLAADSTYTYSGGLYSKNVTLTIDGTDLVGDGGDSVAVTTGAGNDTITFTGDATYVGLAGAGGSIVISAGAGDDTISVTVGTMLAQTTTNFLDITGGTGADTITKTGTNSTTVQSTANFIFAEGDSTTAARDKITGFDVADGTNLSDLLDFAGTGAVSTFSNTVDFGTILSHNLSNGVVTFDDAAAFSAAIVINATNLADALGYLAANTADNDVVAFAYDSNADGTNDATLVFHNGAATNSLVELVGVTGVVALTATPATATANYIAIA